AGDTMHSSFDLQRFVEAQQPIFQQALAELRAGHKQSHWIWFVFPQIAGLGHSVMARRYALSGIDEALAYLSHPVLGPRLKECATVIIAHSSRPIRQILGSPDDLKLRSSMTLFAAASPAQAMFRQVLDAFVAGEADTATLARLTSENNAPG